MSDNIEQFAIYSAKIFELLYDSFPVAISLNGSEITLEYLSFCRIDELKRLHIKKDISCLIQLTDDELKEEAQKQLPEIERRISYLENEQQVDKHRQKSIYDGTLYFLMYEGMIREHSSAMYQLTSKGFSHLNKIFQNGEISDNTESNISMLKQIFNKSSDTSLQVGTGVAVNVITKMLGYV